MILFYSSGLKTHESGWSVGNVRDHIINCPRCLGRHDRLGVLQCGHQNQPIYSITYVSFHSDRTVDNISFVRFSAEIAPIEIRENKLS